MRRYWNRIWESIERRDADEAEAVDSDGIALPTIWLLGKSGAGKSSVVRLLTGTDEIEIGRGYEPCTTHARLYKFPQDGPVLQFLDTRGLGEEGYDPASDLAAHSGSSAAVLAVARIDDPAQGVLCDAIRSIRKTRPGRRIIVLHSRADAVADNERRELVRNANHRAIEQAAGRNLSQVEIGSRDLDGIDNGRDRILQLFEDSLPLAAFLFHREERGTRERMEFSRIRLSVARNSLLAGASAIVPVVGAGTLLAIQGRMLTELARHYDVDLNKKVLVGLGSTLGAGFVARYAAIQLARQASTLVPGFGQAAGAVLAGVTAFSATFALGRAAGYYLFQLKEGEPPSRKEMRRIYRSALRNARHSYKSDE